MIPDRFNLSYTAYRLLFKEPGGTSRGILREKLTYFLRMADVSDPSNVSFGEIPFFHGLSKESLDEMEIALNNLCKIHTSKELDTLQNRISSLDFGIQQASQGFSNSREGLFFPSEFTEGKTDLIINGLIWMGNTSRMRERIREKLRQGFSCIKIKIGALDWDEELGIIKFVRDAGGYDLSLRVDANGAFSGEDCMRRLDDLSRFDIHSIEQPVSSGCIDEMRRVCGESPVPVALDEELIGFPVGPSRSELIDFIRPAYLVLKPALCYGFAGTKDWIERADAAGIGWWITSALESSVGLDAIAQFTGKLKPGIPQGLGTGALYTNNFNSPLCLKGEYMSFCGPAGNYYNELEKLDWVS